MTDTSADDSGVMAVLVRHIADVAAASGMSLDRIFEMTGLDRSLLDQTAERIPVSYFATLVCAGAEVSGDPLMGLHMSERSTLEGFGILGYLSRTCATVQELVELVIRYESLVSDIGRTSVRHEPGIALWCWHIGVPDGTFAFHATDYIIGFARASLRHLLKGVHAPVRHVYLSHAAPNDPDLIAEYERVFDCPVHFGRPYSALALDVDTMKQPLANPDPHLQTVLEQHARQLLGNKSREASFMDRVRNQLSVLLNKRSASREHLAQALGVSERHLCRHLEREGLTYRTLLDELRLEVVCAYLDEANTTIKEIAERLGFTESQSFIRWFRKHKGMTPGQYRAANSGAGGSDGDGEKEENDGSAGEHSTPAG